MIGKSIYKLLVDNVFITTHVGTKIYPVMARQAAVDPMIIYGVSGTRPEETKLGVSKEDWVSVEVLVYAQDYDQIHAIAKEVRLSLDYKTGNIEGNEISNIVFENYNDSYENERQSYVGVLQFTVISKP